MRPEFLWERRTTRTIRTARLFLLLPIDVKWVANRVSCDQDIAADGFFSLGMIARLEPSLRERGDWFYRRLFWECGLIGQVLYLEAEAAGARGTGIGCFYDDPVHELLGLSGHSVAEPVSLLDGRAGRGPAPDDRTGLFVGDLRYDEVGP